MTLKSDPPVSAGGRRVERAAKLSLSYSSTDRPTFSTSNILLPDGNTTGNEKTSSEVSPAFGVSWGNHILTETQGDYKRGGENAPVSLGNTTIKVTPPYRLADTQGRKVLRYAIQQGIAHLLDGERVSHCLRMRLPNKENVLLLRSKQGARYGNVMVCGSIWACPICAVRITEKRREELAGGLAGWQGGVLMGAFTLQHKRGDKLADLRGILADAFKKMQQGSTWGKLKARYGIIGTITSTEVTWGEQAGWHIHKHALWFMKSEVSEEGRAEIERVISKRFRSMLAKLGGFGNEDYAVKFSTGEDTGGQVKYITKWGIDAEMTKGITKKGKDGNLTPFEIAAWWVETGDPQAAALFQEYYSSLKGTKQMTFSHGLRKLLALGAEKTDRELADQEEQEEVLLAEMGRITWAEVCKRNLRGELIEVANKGTPEEVDQFLQMLGVNDYRVYV